MSDDAIALILAHRRAAIGDLLDQLVREDDVLRLDSDLALLRLLEEVLEVLAAIHALLVILVAERMILLLVEEGEHVLLEAATRDSSRLDLIVVARAHESLRRLEVGVDRGDHLAIVLHQRAGALDLREEDLRNLLSDMPLAVLPRDPFGEKGDLHPLGSRLRVVSQRAVEVNRICVLAELLRCHLDHLLTIVVGDGVVVDELEEIPPASVFRDERDHREDHWRPISWHGPRDALPEHLGECPLSLAAADVASLEEQDPEILECGVVVPGHLPELLEMGGDLLLRGAADQESVQDDARIVDAISGVDIAALGADLGESRSVRVHRAVRHSCQNTWGKV